MGMAASQARLLTLTARLHDVELQAQSIMSQKIALATQKDALYQDYCDALDATSIKVAFWNGGVGTTYVDANYSTLCTYNKDRVKQYALKDNQTGNMIVSEEVKNAYQEYGNDKYAFAYAIMGYDASFGWDSPEQGCEIGIGTAQDDYGFYSEGGTGNSLYMTECEQEVYNAKSSDDVDLVDKYNAINEAEGDTAKKEALKNFRDYLYKKYSSHIFEQMNLDKNESKDYSECYDDKEWTDIAGEFNYYINLWNAINQAGGCQTVDPEYESGEEGNQWFNNMVESGMLTIQVWDDTGSQKEWSDTSVATSTNNNYLQNMQNDKELKKAEAEYEHELDILNRKDTKFDTDLSKLETERTSITTEMDSIKKVKDENIERTFGIFS
ncbi:hypothetical protein IJ384_05655 [bacterium]|nr:hypothetical protein [bacterium]